MEKVYLSKDVKKILEKIDYSRLGERVAIKVHFGEKGCTTYINPVIVKAVYDKIISLGKRASLVECNVLYRGSRINAKKHVKLAKKHGFDFAPIDILDGERGEEFIEVDGAKLGGSLTKYDSIVLLTHFTGHGAAGFGGAFKNMGMGFGSRAGKLYMHSDIRSLIEINSKKCIGCGTCVENCNANAISLVDGKAKINHERCEGCAMCIAVCPEKAVKILWERTGTEKLQKKIIDCIKGVMKIIPKDKMIFINVLENITKNCDCINKEQKLFMDDIGILVGENIVAIDKASLDLVNKYSNGKFDKVSSVNKTAQFDYAVKKGLGSKDYEIVGLDD